MSNVGVTTDRFEAKRNITLGQERKIAKEDRYRGWRKSDATKVLLIERAVGFAAVPVLVFWAVLMTALSIGLGFCLLLFRGMTSLFGRTKIVKV